MDFILDAVSKYISLPQTSYALQLNGEWGTGKTFYVKNNLIVEVEKLKNEEQINYQCCYISLNGFSEVDQIGEAVFLELAGGTNKFFHQGAKILGRYGGVLNALGDYTQVTKNMQQDFISKLYETSTKTLRNVILIFDDLERIDETLSLKQVLGYINSNYIESHQVKVIFISNDRKINEVTDFKEIKEKIIGKTIEFKQNDKEVIVNIARNTYKECTDFLNFFEKEKEELVPTITHLYSNLNLRTLRFVYDTFIILQKEAIKNEITNHDVHKSIFLDVLVISKEYKEGKVSSVKELNFLHGRHQFKYLNIYSSNENENEYEHEYIQKYHTNESNYFSQSIHYFKSVSQYIIEGFLDSNELIVELQNHLDFKRKSINQNSKKKTSNFEILNAFNYYEENTIKEVQLEVLNQVKEGIFSCPEIIEITSIFLNLRDNGILFDETKDAKSILIEEFNNLLSKWTPPEDFYKWGIRNGNLHTEANFMVKLLDKRCNYSNYISRKENMINLLDAMNNDELTSEIYKKVEHEREFFKILDEINFIDYLSKSNKLIAYMNYILSEKYLSISNASDFVTSEEIDYIERLSVKIESYLKGASYSVDKIKLYNLKRMLDQLSKVKKHLQIS